MRLATMGFMSVERFIRTTAVREGDSLILRGLYEQLGMGQRKGI
jgi:hypothetical protein